MIALSVTFTVPLVTVFTKFDGHIVQQFGELDFTENYRDKWDKARENAEISFQKVYLPKVLNAPHPPRAYTKLEGENSEYVSAKNRNNIFVIDMDLPENNCPELTQKTADAIDDASLHQLFVSTQMNNIDLCVKAALQYVSI